MRYTVEITLADVVAGNNLHMWGRQPWKQRVLLFWVLYFAVILWAMGLNDFARGKVALTQVICWGPPLFMLTLVFIVYFWPLWMCKRGYRQQNKKPHRFFEFEFTEQNFCASSDTGNMCAPWADFHKWKEDNKTFLVYMSDYMYTVIPKRIFATPEEEQFVRTSLANALGPARESKMLKPYFFIPLFVLFLLFTLLATFATIGIIFCGHP